MRVGILAAANQLPEARVLALSLERFHPDWPRTALFTGEPRPRPAPDEPFSVAPRSHLRRPGRSTPVVLRALLAAHLLGQRDDHVVLLDADSEVVGPLLDLEAALDDHRAVLLRRLTGRLPDDGERPDGRDLLERGELDEGLVALRNDELGQELARWWIERSLEQAELDKRESQNPLAAAQRVFGDVLTLDDPGYGLSAWSLHERRLEGTVDDLRAAGSPARLLRFAGFRPDRPWWLGDPAGRVLVLDDPLLTELCRRRSTALIDAGWAPEAAPAAQGEAPHELAQDARLRRLHDEALDSGEDFGDLETPAGFERLRSWLGEPAPNGAADGIDRYAYDVWRERPDLRDAYPDLDGPDGAGFVGWLWVHGRDELSLKEHLLPPPPKWLSSVDARLPAVEVVGYLRGNLGLGAAARGYVTALQAAGVQVATHTVFPDPPSDRPGAQRVERPYEDLALPGGVVPEVSLLCVNADQLPEVLAESAGRSRYTIGQWAWETDAIPQRWEGSFELVDEIWVYSTYVAENLSRSSPVPVVVVPLPVPRPEVDRRALTLPVADGAYVFLFAFDYLSMLQRKNPDGVVEAFSRAFAPGEGPTLLLKTINAELRPQERERLRWAVGERTDIVLLDRTMSETEMEALLARADCYVSLHRSEGFGLPLAESMSLGKPVIATGFGGNTDFMTPANSFLVDWRPTEVGPDAEHYPAQGTWAEPSVEHAAALLRDVWDSPEEARRRGERAARDIGERLSAESVAAVARARLARVWARREGSPDSDGPPRALTEMEERLRFDPHEGGRSGPRALARRGVLRSIRPFTAPERALDEAVAAVLRGLYGDLEGARFARERDLARIARLEAAAQALEDRAAALTAALEDRAAALAAALEGSASAVQLDAVSARLEPLTAAAEAVPFAAEGAFESFDHPLAGRVLGFRSRAPGDAQDNYRRFEDVFRGSPERVAELVRPYLPLLAGHGPVLDVGCGRGELIELLVQMGVQARGVDADAGMAAAASGRGLEVTPADGVDHLEAIEPGSLGAVTAMHVIEHLPFDRLRALLAAARVALRPGGLLVAETVNPHAGFALKTFWVDPTHRHPLFPESMLVLAETAGFGSAFIAHMRGVGDPEVDRFQQDSYALVAQRDQA